MSDADIFDEVQQKKEAPSGAWKPGQSGNPKGRPKKNQALSAILATAAKKNLYIKVEGIVKKITRNELIAEILMESVVTGTVTFPQLYDADEEELEISEPFNLDSSEWLKLIDFYYKRVEGNPGTKTPEKDDDKWEGLTKEEAEEISKKRWDSIGPQLVEALTLDEEWVNETPTDQPQP